MLPDYIASNYLINLKDEIGAWPNIKYYPGTQKNHETLQ